MRGFDTAFNRGGIGSEEYAAIDGRYRPFLKYYQEAFGYSDLLLVSQSGDAVFSIMKGEDLGSNYYSGPYRDSQLARVVDRARTLLQTEVSDFAYYPPTHEPAAFIAAPIFGEGEVIGIIVLQLNNAEVYQLVQDYAGLGETGETIAASKADGRVAFVAPTRHDPNAAFQTRIAIGSDEAIPVQQAVEGGDGTGVYVDYRGKEVLAAWRYSPELRWGVLVKIDLAEAFAPVATLRNRLAAVGVGVVLFVVLASLLISESISRPIRKLTEISRMIAGGDLTKRADISSRNELGELAESFNDMTARLREAQEELEQRVQERTAELAQANEELKREIAERRRAEADLAYERFLLVTLMDYSPDCIYYKDSDSRFIRVSKAMAAYFRLRDPSEASGKSDFDFFDAEKAKQYLADEQQVMRNWRACRG